MQVVTQLAKKPKGISVPKAGGYTVNFTKQMIDLVKEIRRRASGEDKPGIKLANPDLLEELIPVYQHTKDAVTKALIKELFYVAGEGWAERLQAPAANASTAGSVLDHQPKKTYITKTYRGQTQLIEVILPDADPAPAPQRIYRGRPVDS